jgi:hypothetical protein
MRLNAPLDSTLETFTKALSDFHGKFLPSPACRQSAQNELISSSTTNPTAEGKKDPPTTVVLCGFGDEVGSRMF